MYIFDAHIDTLARLVEKGGTVDLDSPTDFHVNLSLMQKGNVRGQIFAIFVDPIYYPGMTMQKALEMVDAFWENMRLHPDILGPVLHGKDLDNLEKEGKIACLLSLEGGEPLLGNLANLRNFYRLGVRALTLTWNNRNELGDGVGERRAKGLSDFGCQVVEAMHEMGMIVDVSHLAEPGFWDVIELTDGPLIASHSNAKGLWDHRRNLTDKQIRAIADRGGVIGVNFCPPFLADEAKGAALDDVVEQIMYLANTGGVDCVGLGSDFDGIGSTPVGLEDISTLPRIGEVLLGKGWGEEDIAKVLGGNLRRVIKEVLG